MQQMNYSTGEYSILMDLSLAMISMTISFNAKILMKYRYKHILSSRVYMFWNRYYFSFYREKSDMRWFLLPLHYNGSGFALLFGIIMSQALFLPLAFS